MNKRVKYSQSNLFLYYPTRPHVFDARQAFDRGILKKTVSGIVFTPGKKASELGFKKKLIQPQNIYCSLSQEMEGLNEALEDAEGGSLLRKLFNPEWDKFRHLREVGKEYLYGVYIYYPAQGDLVQIAPEKLHRLNLITSNATLYKDPENKLSFEEIRDIFDNLVIAVAGGSVGNNIARMITKDIRPKRIKIADQRLYKWANANRVDLFYNDLIWPQSMVGQDFAPSDLKNKAIGTAAQIHKSDPFMEIWAYYLGINETTIRPFVEGEGAEPKAKIVIDEMDSLEMKFLIAQQCRKSQVILIRGTDAGSIAQIDIMRFDKNPGLSLAVCVDDDTLYLALNKYRENQSKKNFFAVADLLLGKQHKKDEFAQIINDKTPNMFTSIPQLGSTAALTASLVTEIAARIALGFDFPQRIIVDKRNFTVKILN